MIVSKSLNKKSLHQTSRIGAQLVRHKLISRSQLATALWTQRSSNKYLGEILVDQQAITRRQLSLSLRWQALVRRLCIATALVLAPLQLVQAADRLDVKGADNAYLKLPTMGATGTAGPAPANLAKAIEHRFNSPMWTLLKGEYRGGAGEDAQGLRYKAKWSQKSVRFEVKYQF